MALKICRSAGQQFRVGNVVFTVVKVRGPQAFIMERQGGAVIQRFEIDHHVNEVLPHVKISAGRSERHGRAWITIDAPRDIRIERIPAEVDEFGDDEPPQAA